MRMVAKGQQSKCSLLRKPHFFKVLMGNFAERLKIPPRFMKHISEEAPKRVFVHGPGGSSWRVGLRETPKGTFLSSGWRKFVKDHSLRAHEFLVFRYDGNMRFSVQIFDATACEREDAFKIRSCTKSATSKGANKRCVAAKRSSDIGCLVQHNESENVLPMVLKDEIHSSNRLRDRCSNSIQGRSVLTPKPIGDVNVKSENDELPICVIRSQSKSQSYVSRSRPVTAEEREQARKAAHSFSSCYPYVILCMPESSVSRKCVLRFPVKFSRTHLPRKRTNLLLRDPSGKEWEVFYIPDTRDRLSAGWSSFVRGNNLEEGDFCVFELSGPLEMRVHIFRVVK